MTFSDFTFSSDQAFTIGTDIQGTKDENGNHVFKNHLVSISVNDGKLILERVRELENISGYQYYFGDTVLKDNYMYAILAGTQNLSTYEKSFQGGLVRYDLQKGTYEYFLINQIAPMNAYDIGNDFLAISHEPATCTQLGFTLFNYRNCMSSFVNLSSLDTEDMEFIVDIKRFDSENLLILTNKQIFGYNLQMNKIAFQNPHENLSDTPFHIWIAH